ncbi:HDOD domain-containing protein, partial [Fibrobacterota bacterium]
MKEEKPATLILLFSPREKVRSILTAGFLQSDYRIIEAHTSYIAGIKANQYLPDLIIADITQNNIKDFLFLSRLERSTRTRDITVLLSVTPEVKKALDKIREEVGAVVEENEEKRVHVIEYPYNFNDLVKKIISIFSEKSDDLPEETKGPTESNRILGERLFDPQIKILDKLHIIEGTIEKQWAFPFTVVRSLEIIGSEKSCCTELAKCIEADIAAASAILSMSNKVHYASRYGRITNVLDAVVRIGFNDTRNILAGLALIDVSPEVYLQYGFKRTEFWMHSLATAIIAEKLCRNTKVKRPELAFIAGLIHDLGKIPLDNNFTNIFTKLLEETTNTISSFYETEMKLMGFSHAGLGHFFTTNWGFPSPITMSILNHHDCDKIINTKIQEDRVIQESVYVANILSKAMNLGHSCDEVLNAIPEKILKELGIPEGPKDPFLKKIFETLKLYY